MQRALDEARKAYSKGEIPIGAVVVCKDRIISRAHNLTETLCDVAGDNLCSQSPWREISHRLHSLCHRRALRDVCRSHRMGTDTAHRLWLPR